MSAKASRIALCTAGAVLLSGCQFFGGLHFSHRDKQDSHSAQAANEYYTVRGRELLRAGQPGAAIEAFNLALATGEAPAPAYNGLGIAYVRIGRPELGYRFFKKANMSDPANQTYAANLDRLMTSPQFSLDMTRDYVLPAAPQPDLAAERAARAQAEQPKQVAGRLHRDGPHQFSIVTLPAENAASESASRRAQGDRCTAKRKGVRQSPCAVPKLGVVVIGHPRVAKPAASGPVSTPPAAAEPAAAATPKRKVVDLRGMPATDAPARAKPVAAPLAAS